MRRCSLVLVWLAAVGCDDGSGSSMASDASPDGVLPTADGGGDAFIKKDASPGGIDAAAMDGAVDAAVEASRADAALDAGQARDLASESTAGNADIGIVFNTCPQFTALSANPPSAKVGALVNLAGNALDAEGNTLTFRWSAPVGTLATPDAKTTTYECTIAGTHTITLTVSDGGCDEKATTQVTCTP